MASLTRWVLAHKRIVAVFWIVLTLVGMASAGSATKALKQKFSVPGKEGWVTNQQIQREFNGTGGNGAPLLPVVTLPAGASLDSPAVRAELRGVEARLARALPGSRIAGFASTGNRAFVSKDGRTTFAVAYPPPDRTQPFDRQPESRGTRRRGAAGRDRRRRAGPPDRLRRAVGAERRRQRTRRARRGAARRLRRAARARVRVRLVPRDRADHDGHRLDHDHVPARLGADGRDRSLADRAVPDRADRARRVDRLRAARRRPLARGDRATGARATRRSCARWRPPGVRSCSAARPSRSACSRSSRCRCRSCARSAMAGC